MLNGKYYYSKNKYFKERIIEPIFNVFVHDLRFFHKFTAYKKRNVDTQLIIFFYDLQIDQKKSPSSPSFFSKKVFWKFPPVQKLSLNDKKHCPQNVK